MEAASPLACSGIEPLRRPNRPLHTLAASGHRSFPASVRVRKRNGVVRAVATEPKPADVKKSNSPPKVVNGSSSSLSSSVNGVPTGMTAVSQEIKRVRAQMEENEQLASLMKGLRGQNLNDSQFAADDVELRLVEVDESSEFLPLVYDPASISAYWGKRPRAVATRVAQLTSVAGGFLSRFVWDVINKKVKENEVSRAIELREIVTSLGPAYIKLGQALSIRPDILSPAAMTELQKLCDKERG